MAGELWRKGLKDYRGLTMRCAPGTHEAAMAMLQKLNVSPGPTLDLASGSGAWLARLKEHGWTDLTAVELDATKFGLSGLTPLAVDLNRDFAATIGRKFSLISAIEIIEHLNSPRHFLTEARALLADDGILLVSTPNIADWMGRIKFLLTGTLRFFDDTQYRYNHHISPLPSVQMGHLLNEVGLKIRDQKTAGNSFGPAKMAVMAPLWIGFRIFCGASAMGDVLLYALSPAEPKVTQAIDWTPK